MTDSSAPPAEGPVIAARERFFDFNDCVKLIHCDRIVGVFIGAPEDWSTYYCRATE